MTVYESAITKRPRLRLLRALKRHLDLLLNSGSLMGATLVTSILGFAYWWVAARAFTPETVGTASAIVSTLTLVGTLSVFGMGTLLISELSGLPGREWNFIGACMLASSIAATAGGLIYIVLARFVITGLRRSVGSAPTTILLLVGVVVTATTLVLDDGLLGLLAGPKQLLRNTYFAVLKLVGLGVLALLPITVHPGHVLATWVGGGVLSVVLLWGALRKQGLRGIPLPQLSLLRGRLGQAVEHNILNVALFVPRTVLPLVVTAVLSPTATAAFYTAYMMVSFVTMVPNHLATTLFAATAGNMVALRAKIRMALLVSVGIGVPACLGLAVLAHPVMQLFGHAYAQHASTALTIMALAYPAMIFRPLYVAASRVAGRVRRASVFAIVAGACEVGGASYGASRGSLTDLAVWLAGAFVLEGLLTAPTVLSLALRRPNAFSHARGGWRSSR
ncbi:MAG TPA: hypothetical protein VJT31_12125, partial [Rugosimonospora sp.]|nr:hypothetical protein [Rugosimonospora sp.]